MSESPHPTPHPPPHPALHQAFGSVRAGAPRQHGAMTVFPLRLPGDTGPDYVTLDEAISAGAFRVTEISEAGAVPILQVTNALRRGVLLIDGEELVGAKQNRAVNLSLLIPSGFQGTIPVSCTEHGRWHPTSAEFAPSPNVVDRETRRRKSAAVSESLRDQAAFSSGKSQKEVWNSILALQEKAQHLSATSASHDVFLAKEKELAQALSVFSAEEGQHGLLVFLHGVFAGLDLVSRADAYARLHPKLVRSYAMEAVLAGHPRGEGAGPDLPTKAAADAILRRAAKCAVRAHPAVGIGETLRGEEQDLTGTALVADGVTIHAAFFGPSTSPAEPSNLPERRRRARHTP